jgi:hypothetical protein
VRRRNWKHAQPSCLRQALEWSIEFARERHNLSVERIAERMGLDSHWTLYKWVNNGRIPAVMIPTFEHVCGINLVSRWLASTAGKLLIDLPTGRNCSSQDVQLLQSVLHDATGALLAFYAGKTDDIDQTLAALQVGLEVLAWHRGNVSQHQHPQFDLGGQSDE